MNEFTISLWFNRESDSSTTQTNHQIHNILLAQSSGSSNDNLETGSFGSLIQVYADMEVRKRMRQLPLMQD